MYSLTKLSSVSRSFLVSLTSTGRGRSIATSIAVARVIADRLQLPSAAVDSLGNYYRTMYALDVERDVSQLNELAVINTQEVLELIGKFYEARYNIIHGTSGSMLRGAEKAVEDFFGISKSIDDGVISALKTDTAFISEAVLRFRQVFEETSA